jgi:hypothetical protein
MTKQVPMGLMGRSPPLHYRPSRASRAQDSGTAYMHRSVKEACGGNRGGGPQDSKDVARGQKPA